MEWNYDAVRMHGNFKEHIESSGETQLWFATPGAEEFFEPETLSAAEMARLRTSRTARRQQEFKVSRALKTFVSRERGRDTLNSSLTHSSGYAALLLGPADVQLGVDLELARPRDVLRIARDVFEESELRWLLATEESRRLQLFYALWTLKEAFIKALSLNLFDGLRQCVFSRSDLGWTGKIPTSSCWFARVYQPQPEFFLAAAWVGSASAPGMFEWPPKRAAAWPIVACASSELPAAFQ